MTRAMLLVAVVADELEEKAVAIIREEGGQGVTILPGRGLGFPEHTTFFGLTYRGLEKILLCALDEVTAERAAGRLNQELHLLRPFQGLAFSLKLGATGGMSADEIRRFIEAGRPNTAQESGAAD
ncbi:hypothetical protein [Thioalkalivibrio sulfidiphilus]|uniref:hypothetical protein n=1 Tax=Thioalkalivibrio sulfidiphilus TaxID=1033854 RepID=UPI00037C56DC|nr:hypothetical protein [Thioalkalivibrio sulfidiphilus]